MPESPCSVKTPQVQVLKPAGRPFQHVDGSSSWTICREDVCTPSMTPTLNADVVMLALPECGTPRVPMVCGNTAWLMIAHAAKVNCARA